MFKACFFSAMLLASPAMALGGGEQYSKYFEVDLEADLPKLSDLEKKYLPEKSKLYDRKYDYYWNVGNTFDKAFRLVIASYGLSEKRLKHADEDNIIKMLEGLPKESYPYIGPVIHTLPNMPEKVLNMPGIKETKNRFPDRIAPQMQEVEDVEFLSPHLYFLLMPEAWPGNAQAVEMVQVKRFRPRTEHQPVSMEKVRELVEVEDFLGDGKGAGVSNSDLRTLDAGAESQVSSADIKAFANTLLGVKEFGERPGRMLQLSKAGMLLDLYEKDQERGLSIAALKDMVNPCQRLAQKIRLLELKDEFEAMVGAEGFDLNSWAYTCDNTIKAYRVAAVKSPTVSAVRSYKQGMYKAYREIMGEAHMNQQLMVMQAISEMYQAPMSDVLEARKNRELLEQKFRLLRHTLLVEPIYLD